MKNEIEVVTERDEEGQPLLFYIKFNGIEVPRSRILASEDREADAAHLYYIHTRLKQGYSIRMAVIKPGEENE